MTMHPAIQEAGWALAGERGADVGAALTNFLRSLDAPPRLLGFGEFMHWQETLPRLRNQMFRHLVEHEGYRSIALESSCLAGLTVDAFLGGGAGSLEDTDSLEDADSLDEVMRRGFTHGFGDLEANRELVQWMREHNRDRPAAERLRFFGFDSPTESTTTDSPRQVLTALHRYLAAHVDATRLPCGADTIEDFVGGDERWTNPAAIMDPSQSMGTSEDARQLRLIADDLAALLESETPHLVAATSRERWWTACLYARTAVGLLRYHAKLADPSPDRVVGVLAARGTMMADNLLAIADHQAHHGPTLVFANNGHLQKGPAGWPTGDGQEFQWWPAGSVIHTRRGDAYAVIASALGAAPDHGIPAPPAGTIEGLLSTYPDDQYLIPTTPLAAALASRDGALRQRISPIPAYAPLDPTRLTDADAVAFLKQI